MPLVVTRFEIKHWLRRASFEDGTPRPMPGGTRHSDWLGAPAGGQLGDGPREFCRRKRISHPGTGDALDEMERRAALSRTVLGSHGCSGIRAGLCDHRSTDPANIRETVQARGWR